MPDSPPILLITGAAQRIGRALALHFHSQGYHILLHYHRSLEAAQALADTLNRKRPDSVRLQQANLLEPSQVRHLAEAALAAWGHVDLLINNASSFYPTPLNQATDQDWDALLGSNARAPFLLSQALADSLRERRGCIINMIDIHARSGLRQHTLYTMGKAALAALTKTLARDLAPEVRVNGIAPGAILWPEAEASLSEEQKNEVLAQVCLGRLGSPADIVHAADFLASAASSYVNGQIIAVDGGRSLRL